MKVLVVLGAFVGSVLCQSSEECTCATTVTVSPSDATNTPSMIPNSLSNSSQTITTSSESFPASLNVTESSPSTSPPESVTPAPGSSSLPPTSPSETSSAPPLETNPNCGPQANGTICTMADYPCCSKDGFCGNTGEYCSQPLGCQVEYGYCSPLCGNIDGIVSMCPYSCCGRNNSCGSLASYCDIGLGCQTAYGLCSVSSSLTSKSTSIVTQNSTTTSVAITDCTCTVTATPTSGSATNSSSIARNSSSVSSTSTRTTSTAVPTTSSMSSTPSLSTPSAFNSTFSIPSVVSRSNSTSSRISTPSVAWNTTTLSPTFKSTSRSPSTRTMTGFITTTITNNCSCTTNSPNTTVKTATPSTPRRTSSEDRGTRPSLLHMTPTITASSSNLVSTNSTAMSGAPPEMPPITLSGRPSQSTTQPVDLGEIPDLSSELPRIPPTTPPASLTSDRTPTESGRATTTTQQTPPGNSLLTTSSFFASTVTATGIIALPIMAALTSTLRDCGQCTIYAGHVQLFYWEKRQSSTIISEETTEVAGFVMTYSSAYVALETAWATNLCGAVGGAYGPTLISLNPMSISTPNSATIPEAVDWNKFATEFPDPASMMELERTCVTDNSQRTFSSGHTLNLVVPHQLRTRDQAWASCAYELRGCYDPPFRLGEVTVAATPTLPTPGSRADLSIGTFQSLRFAPTLPSKTGASLVSTIETATFMSFAAQPERMTLVESASKSVPTSAMDLVVVTTSSTIDVRQSLGMTSTSSNTFSLSQISRSPSTERHDFEQSSGLTSQASSVREPDTGDQGGTRVSFTDPGRSSPTEVYLDTKSTSTNRIEFLSKDRSKDAQHASNGTKSTSEVLYAVSTFQKPYTASAGVPRFATSGLMDSVCFWLLWSLFVG